MIRNIIVPEYLDGIKHTRRGFPKQVYIMGGDTETYDGEPNTFQLHADGGLEKIEFCNKDNVTEKFINALRDWKFPTGVKIGVLFFHNLAFDLPVLLYKHMQEFKNNSFTLLVNDAVIEVLCGKMTTASIYFKTKDKKLLRKILVVDSMRFLPGSLENVAKELKLSNKLQHPEGFGVKLYTPEDKEFIKYALQDALVEYEIGCYIINMHREYDVAPSVSIAQMAQRIFTHNFFPKGIRCDIPKDEICQAALKSYHGGKNNFTLTHPQKIKDVYELDVVSMYPDAMANLPAWTSGTFQWITQFNWEYVGIYCIWGYAKECKYPIICDHNFKYKTGYIEGIWMCGYEIAEALNSGELELTKCVGWIWIPDQNATNPFKDYVKHFVGKKKTCQDSRRWLYKICLNSLYGKTIQSVDWEDPGKEFDVDVDSDMNIKSMREVQKVFKAGGLYNPFLASCITSYARVRLHQLEHKYQSIDCSTDSVKTIMTPDPKDLGENLGQLQVKNFGDCIFLRNKLYVHFGKKMTYALHGFQGKVDDLLKIWETGKTKYKHKHMNRPKESINRGIKPLIFTEVEAELKLNKWDVSQKNMDKLMDEIIYAKIDRGAVEDNIDYHANQDGLLSKSEQKQSDEDLRRRKKYRDEVMDYWRNIE